MKRLTLLLATALAATALTGCGSHSSGSRLDQATQDPKRGASLRDVESVDQLRTLFNADLETPRLIVLASPT